MTAVLLITEQTRLRQLFTKLEHEGLFRLRIAPTLAQGEEEIAVRVPDYVFVQNHISGLSGEVIVRYLRGLLPEGAEVILMTRDAADADEIREVGTQFLDLSGSDEALRLSIGDTVPKHAPRENPPPAGPLPAPPRTAKELLFDAADREVPAGKQWRRLWLVPVLLAVISLSVIAYHVGKMAPQPPEPAQKSVAVTPQAGGAGSESKKVLPAGKSPVRSGEATASSGRYRHYVVQPGDNLQKILIRDFGYSEAAALALLPEVKRLNNMKDLKSLKLGQKLTIPVARKRGKLAK